MTDGVVFSRACGVWKVDHFTDHSIHQYIEAIQQAVMEDLESVAEGDQAKTAEELVGDETEYTPETSAIEKDKLRKQSQ